MNPNYTEFKFPQVGLQPCNERESGNATAILCSCRCCCGCRIVDAVAFADSCWLPHAVPAPDQGTPLVQGVLQAHAGGRSGPGAVSIVSVVRLHMLHPACCSLSSSVTTELRVPLVPDPCAGRLPSPPRCPPAGQQAAGVQPHAALHGAGGDAALLLRRAARPRVPAPQWCGSAACRLLLQAWTLPSGEMMPSLHGRTHAFMC